MIRSIEIKKFKALKSIKLSGAQRVNVLVGPNGTGKTAFLEALFLAGGQSPELLHRFRQWRGRDAEIVSDIEQLYRALFGELFWSKTDRNAEIKLVGDDNKTRALEISRVEPEEQITPSGEIRYSNTGIKFKWTGPDGSAEVIPQIDGTTLNLGKAPIQTWGAHFIPARTNVSEAESARAYSNLRINGDAKIFEDAFLKEYPSLESLSIESPSGQGAIFARIKGGQKKMLPLAEISGGMNHVAGIMVRLASSRGAAILVDEIENGIYHEQYESIWRSIYELSKKTDSQLFATTHSLECLEALAVAMKDNPNDVRFFRTRLSHGDVVIEQLGGETLFKALKLGDPR